MYEIDLLKQLITEIIKNDSILTISGGRGHSAGKVNTGGKPLMGFGKSNIAYMYGEKEEEEDSEHSKEDMKSPVKISKVFDVDDADDFYKRILEDLNNDNK